MKVQIKLTIKVNDQTEVDIDATEEMESVELDEIVAAGRELFELEGD